MALFTAWWKTQPQTLCLANEGKLQIKVSTEFRFLLSLLTCAASLFASPSSMDFANSNLRLYLDKIDLLLITLLKIVSTHDSIPPSICSNKQIR